jgi:hypothetical protein
MSAHPRPRRFVLLASIGVMVGGFALPVLTATPAYASCSTVREGSHGSCVLTLQRRLVALHYDLSSPDGAFGSQTYHAVVAFQKVNGLKRTGVVGSGTWWRLYHGTVVPRARYARTGTALEVNVTKQVLYRTKGGAVVRIYDVSTGRPSLPTPVRYSHPLRIWKKTYAGTTGYGDIEHYVQYYYAGSLLAIHAYDYVPAYPASHGCIRVPPPGAARLYAATYVGERVYTYT